MKKKILTALLVGVMAVTTTALSYVADAGQTVKAEEAQEEFKIAHAGIVNCHDGKVLVNSKLDFSVWYTGAKGDVKLKYFISDDSMMWSPRTQIENGYTVTKPGYHIINIVAEDSEGNIARSQFDIEVVKEFFQITKCKVNGEENPTVSVGKPVVFSIDNINSRGNVKYRYYIAADRFSKRTQINQYHIINEPGVYTIDIAAEDDLGDTANYEFNLTVK